MRDTPTQSAAVARNGGGRAEAALSEHPLEGRVRFKSVLGSPLDEQRRRPENLCRCSGRHTAARRRRRGRYRERYRAGRVSARRGQAGKWITGESRSPGRSRKRASARRVSWSVLKRHGTVQHASSRACRCDAERGSPNCRPVVGHVAACWVSRVSRRGSKVKAGSQSAGGVSPRRGRSSLRYGVAGQPGVSVMPGANGPLRWRGVRRTALAGTRQYSVLAPAPGGCSSPAARGSVVHFPLGERVNRRTGAHDAR